MISLMTGHWSRQTTFDFEENHLEMAKRVTYVQNVTPNGNYIPISITLESNKFGTKMLALCKSQTWYKGTLDHIQR